MKTITPLFIQRGKRRKLDGFLAEYDGYEVGIFDTERQAEKALDEYALETLQRASAAKEVV
jgi:hypothetical protein